jgi:apolipoprotein N-acyltransferase
MTLPSSEARTLIERRYVLVGASVLLLFASFHPLDLGLLAWGALVPMLLACVDLDFRGRALISLATGFLFHLIGLSWLALCTPPGWLTTVSAEALYMGASVCLSLWLRRRLSLPLYLTLPLVWTALDFERGRFKFFAFPWLLIGQSQHQRTLLMQSCDLTGLYGPGFLVLMSNGLIFESVLRKPSWLRWLGLPEARDPHADLKLGRGWLSLGALIAIACLYGAVRQTQVEEALEPGPRLLLVQTDFPSRNDQPPPPRRLTTTRVLDQTELAAQTHRGSYDAIVLPETVWHQSLNADFLNTIEARRGNYVPRARLRIDELLQTHRRLLRLVKDADKPVILGAIDQAFDASKMQSTAKHNSAFLLSPKPEPGIAGRYDKVQLVPASEYVPGTGTALFGWFAELLKSFIPAGFTSFEHGAGPVLFDIAGTKIAPDICFDVSYSHFVREATRAGAELHLNIANYSWFRSSQALDLALVQAKLRAIETRRGVIQCVNGGPSASLDPLGRITRQGQDILPHNSAPEGSAGAIAIESSTTRLTSVYMRLGDAFAWLTVIGTGLALAVALRRGAKREG